MDSSVKIPIIIPAYEPDERLLRLLEALKESGMTDIVLVDDGSGDSGKEYFEQADRMYGCRILAHDENMGKGRALKDGFCYCLKEFPALIGCVTADSDGQHTPADIRRCMEALESHSDNLILGCREFSADNVPWKSRFGNNLTRKICRLFCGIDVSDTQTGLRAIPKAFMEELLHTEGERFEFETNMLLESKGKYPVWEVRIETVYDSAQNHQTHFHPVKDALLIYGMIGKYFVKFLISSLSASVIDLILFAVFCGVLKPADERGIWYAAAATVMARLISACYNYLVNYHLVFKSRESKGRALVKYAMLAAVQMLLSAGIVDALVYCFRAKEVPVKMAVDVILFLFSFVIQKAIVFEEKGRKQC